MVILEQFLAVLPADLQIWLRAKEPGSSKEAACLAETFLGQQERADVAKLPVIFEDLSVSFTKKALLDPDQETLYWEVVEENYETLLSVGTDARAPQGDVLQTFWTKAPSPGCIAGPDARVPPADVHQPFWIRTPSPGRAADTKVVIKMEQVCEQEDFQKEESKIAPLQIKQEKDYQSWNWPPVQQGNHLQEEKELLGNSLEENHESQMHIKIEESDNTCSLPTERDKYISQFSGDQKMPIDENSSYKGLKCERSLNLDSDFMGKLEILTELKPPSSPIFGKDLSNSSNLPKTKAERRYKCENCGKSYVWKSSLVRHRKIHTGENPYRCNECGKNFHVRLSFIAHQRIHTGEKPYQCDCCGNCFRTKSSLTAHQIIHTVDKQFPCPDCGKKFRRQAYLRSHYRTHTGERPHQCFVCGKCFTERSSLVRHERIHSMDDSTRRTSLQVFSA